MWQIYLLTFAILAFVGWIVNSMTRHKHDPPGPRKWPILGNLVQLALTGELAFPVKAIHKLALHYGGIMSLRIGTQNTIVVSQFEEYKEILTRDELTERSIYGAMLDRNMGGTDVGIAFANGEPWRNMRRWTVRTLRDYGFGKKYTQESLMDMEGRDLVSYIDTLSKKNNGIVRVYNLHSLSTLNVLWAMVAGFRYQLDDQRLRDLLHLSGEQLKAANFSVSITAAFPSMRLVFPKLTGRVTLQIATKNLMEFLLERLHDHQKKAEYATNPTCLIDAFLTKIDEEKNLSNPLFTAKNFVMTLTDLFQAGSETSSSILDFGLLYMMNNPDVQKKVHTEIDEHVPAGQYVRTDDKEKLPYTYATVLEMYRYANVLPIQINRRVTNEFYSRGYRFPKGYTVLANAYTMFNDPDVWKDPVEFRPERFLDDKMTFIVDKVERIVPFGIGKRICPGQNLGDLMVFMFFVTIMQHYTISGVSGEPKPTTDPRDGMTVSPRPFNAVFKRRA